MEQSCGQRAIRTYQGNGKNDNIEKGNLMKRCLRSTSTDWVDRFGADVNQISSILSKSWSEKILETDKFS